MTFPNKYRDHSDVENNLNKKIHSVSIDLLQT